MRIDLHTHVVPERWEDFASRYGGGRWPRLVHRDACRATIMTGDAVFREVDDRSWRAERRIEDMDRLGIDRQALSPPPVMLCYWADARAGQAFARMQNENVAAIVARHSRRFVGMATVPLQDTSARDRGASACPRAARPARGGDRDLPGRARLRRSGALPVLRGLSGSRRRDLRAPGRATGRPGANDEVLLPADRRQPAGDGPGHLEAHLRWRAGAPARSADLLRARRRGVPVHARAARPRLVGAPGGPGGHPQAAARVRAAAPLRLADAQPGEPPVPRRRVRRRPRGDGERLPVRHGERGPGGGDRARRSSARTTAR